MHFEVKNILKNNTTPNTIFDVGFSPTQIQFMQLQIKLNNMRFLL